MFVLLVENILEMVKVGRNHTGSCTAWKAILRVSIQALGQAVCLWPALRGQAAVLLLSIHRRGSREAAAK